MNKHVTRASQNREELLQAAAEMIKTHGIHVPLQLIINHAGVGRATFYRNFSDRKALVYALLADTIENLRPRVASFENHDDGLFQLIESHIQHLNYLSALKEYWKVLEIDDPVLKQLTTTHQSIIQPLIDRAIATQKCRPDLNFEDYRTIVSILASSFRGHTEQEQKRLATRALDLLFVGIQPSQDVIYG
ncbi:TetR/AcrR family transcriptional regulator [Acinetobacter sp. MD2]|uniref:TetR/AcrR family transcriptional regulator n=1 Tax=Acinetobacter sp. MD2 TaxID=2600066 RepID=UPI002D1EDE94|nr:TetR/AcrR family transcriptional regulator [Acinetobacter sp. MD2]MEB3768003.1 TetR/AcrR family transcriptional regulator [Acinetobacter sp. MD2]